MSTCRQIIRHRLRSTGTRAGELKDEMHRSQLIEIVTLPKYKVEAGRKIKIMPAQGDTRRQRRKDRATHLFLAKIAREKRLAKKHAAVEKQRTHKIISFLRGK